MQPNEGPGIWNGSDSPISFYRYTNGIRARNYMVSEGVIYGITIYRGTNKRSFHVAGA